CLTIGAGQPRNITPEGRNLKGVHFAMEFLGQQNQLIMGEEVAESAIINAKGKHILVIGGGDTGSDCVGTSVRQGATKITQIEILPKPPVGKNPDTTSSSHEEGCERKWSLNTVAFKGSAEQVEEVVVEEVEWTKDATGRWNMKSTGKTETIKADLVFLALGFVHPVHEGLVTELGLSLDARGNIATNKESTSNVAKVFAAGDAAIGASLVVRAIALGRKVAEDIHKTI
ncbi:FAD-dependent oxidoreductase, partial [bacterium]|nr:FAD-dependent oxidoreductase [bacterium]